MREREARKIEREERAKRNVGRWTEGATGNGRNGKREDKEKGGKR